MQDTHRSTLLLGSIYFLLPSIFLLDLQAPLGVAVAILYVVPLFGTRWLARRSHFLKVATIGSIFTLTAPFFSPPAAVRSLTILLVEQETLASYRYLEHGAFYAIIALAVIMFLKTAMHVPEVVTGFIGAGFIVAALVDSIRYNRRLRGA